MHPVRSKEVNCGHLRDSRDTTSSVVGDEYIEGEVVGLVEVCYQLLIHILPSTTA